MMGKKSKFTVVDLFCGAGGFSEGFLSAGCDLIAHIEMDKDACDTIRTRMAYHTLRRAGKLGEYRKYLLGEIDRETFIHSNHLENEFDSIIQAEISQDNIKDLITDVKKRLDDRRLDMIIGGPPCQAYSHIGRSSDKKRMRRDKRKFLYQYYVEFLKAFKPKLFVFENVPGLLNTGGGIYLKNMRRMMKCAGYTTDYQVFNTSDFGIPQNRKRVILMGWRSDSGISQYPNFQTVKRTYKVADFIGDLPKLRAGEGSKCIVYKSSSSLLRRLGITSRDLPLIIDHKARPQLKRDLEIYKIAVKKKNRGRNMLYNELPKKLRTRKNKTSFLDKFKVVDRLALSCHTIIAHIAKDGHYYIHPDIKQNRSLTVREAARLQTFPDNYYFEGTRTSKFRQIGNAVPPMFSKIIAEKLIRLLK